MAVALKAEICEIYTDVDGVYTADPRVVKKAWKIPEISYDEMLDMAAMGALVLQPRSVEVAKRNGILSVSAPALIKTKVQSSRRLRMCLKN